MPRTDLRVVFYFYFYIFPAPFRARRARLTVAARSFFRAYPTLLSFTFVQNITLYSERLAASQMLLPFTSTALCNVTRNLVEG